MSRVLIIEDEMLVALYLESLLSDMGCEEIIVAATEEQACEAAHRMKPDLILADVNLGSGGSGITAVKQIERDHRCPVVFVTGNPEQVLHAAFANTIALVEKPLSPAVLKTTVIAQLQA